MTMLEKVARAIFEARYPSAARWWDMSGYADADKARAQKDAHAAISAMREPTSEMKRSPGIQTNCPMCGGHIEGWHTMIDRALNEK